MLLIRASITRLAPSTLPPASHARPYNTYGSSGAALTDNVLLWGHKESSNVSVDRKIRPANTLTNTIHLKLGWGDGGHRFSGSAHTKNSPPPNFHSSSIPRDPREGFLGGGPFYITGPRPAA